jgi:hypothetical protein
MRAQGCNCTSFPISLYIYMLKCILQPSQRELLPQGHLPWSLSLAITGNEAEQASRSVARKGDLYPNSRMDQKSKVSGSTPLYLYRKGKPKRSFKTHARDSAWCTGRLSLLTVQATQCPTHCEWGPSPHINNIDPPSVVRQQGRRSVMPTISRRRCRLRSSTE